MKREYYSKKTMNLMGVREEDYDRYRRLQHIGYKTKNSRIKNKVAIRRIDLMKDF